MQSTRKPRPPDLDSLAGFYKDNETPDYPSYPYDDTYWNRVEDNAVPDADPTTDL